MDIVTLAARPDLNEQLWDLTSVWPEFMLNDPTGDLYYSYTDRWAEFILLAVDDGYVAARGFSVPFALGEEIGRPELPDGGWDAVVRWSAQDFVDGVPTTHVSALEIGIDPAYRGTGLAAEMVSAMHENARRQGFDVLYAPVRPSRKHLEPRAPMEEYASRIRGDGLPEDPWLRVHARLGATIEKVCPMAMTIPGTLEQWRTWTGLPFDESGEVIVPGALAPVHVSVEQDIAVYVEPNVWMRHG